MCVCVFVRVVYLYRNDLNFFIPLLHSDLNDGSLLRGRKIVIVFNYFAACSEQLSLAVRHG